MKTTIKIEQEFDIKILQINAGVRYWEDTEVNSVEDTNGDLIPCRKGERWCPDIDIETGKIINWRQGVKASVHYKICDDGKYSLLTDTGASVIAYSGYVPDCLGVEDKSYGDYIILDINEHGIINNWKFTQEDVDEFLDKQDD